MTQRGVPTFVAGRHGVVGAQRTRRGERLALSLTALDIGATLRTPSFPKSRAVERPARRLSRMRQKPREARSSEVLEMPPRRS